MLFRSISLSPDKYKAMIELKNTLQVLMAQAVCKDISREEVHELIDIIYDDWNK